MIGWVQSLALAAVLVTLLFMIGRNVEVWLKNIQERKLKEMEHRQSLEQDAWEENE